MSCNVSVASVVALPRRSRRRSLSDARPRFFTANQRVGGCIETNGIEAWPPAVCHVGTSPFQR